MMCSCTEDPATWKGCPTHDPEVREEMDYTPIGVALTTERDLYKANFDRLRAAVEEHKSEFEEDPPMVPDDEALYATLRAILEEMG